MNLAPPNPSIALNSGAILSSPASLRRRLACALYEALTLLVLIIAVGLLAAFVLTFLTQKLAPGMARLVWHLFGWLLFALLPGLYLTWCWRRGQTLAMRTWGLRIESTSGEAVSLKQAWLRYLLACLQLVLLGLGWWLAPFRHDRQFLHDHLAHTRLVRIGGK